MIKEWTTPAGEYPRLYYDILNNAHILIAGASGSGKSVVINGLIYTALYKSPASVKLICIDLKRVELADYKHIPHTIAYADDVKSALNALQYALNIIEKRFEIMEGRRVKLYNGPDIYVIIDEMADLLTTAKRQAVPLIQRICQIGRAARVHLIGATQHIPTIPTAIRVNFDCRIGLRTQTKQDSRNIIGINGCENLPRYGYGFYITPNGMQLYKLPMIDSIERERLISHWTGSAGRGRLRLFGY